MKFDWDEGKRLVNMDKHGIDFVDAKEIWQGDVIEIPSPQAHHGENRYIALGLLRGRVITVIFTWRRRQRRLISARKARKVEKAIYQNATGRGA
jgi:uncharacterized DUF497 family protein